MNMADCNCGRKKMGLSIEEGWPILEESIKNVIDLIDGVRLQDITTAESIKAFTVVHDICQYGYSLTSICDKLYERFQKIFEDYISSKVLPLLRGKKGNVLVAELVQQWHKYKILRKWIVRFFCHLDGCNLGQQHRRSLPKTSNAVFYKMVYGEMNSQVRAALISEINLDRKGEQIDEAAVKNAVEIYMEMADGSLEYYEKDFEKAMVEDTAQFYSKKASEWFRVIQGEKVRLINLLKPESYVKIIRVVEDEVMTILAPKPRGIEQTKWEDD